MDRLFKLRGERKPLQESGPKKNVVKSRMSTRISNDSSGGPSLTESHAENQALNTEGNAILDRYWKLSGRENPYNITAVQSADATSASATETTTPTSLVVQIKAMRKALKSIKR